MEQLKSHTDNGFINLGKIKVTGKKNVSDSIKKIYELLLKLSYSTYKATLMSSIFSQLLKHVIENQKDIYIQLGVKRVENSYFSIQLLFSKEADIRSINELTTVFDNVENSVTEYGVAYVLLEKQLANSGDILSNEFISSTIQKIEIRSQEELFEELVLSNKNLELSFKKIEETNSELETFSYSVSHDLRAPLRHMIGFTELLNKHLVNADKKTVRFLSNIMNSSKRMGKLIDDLLSFSRTGRTALKPQVINLQQIIEDVRSGFSREIENRIIDWKIHDIPNAVGDHSLIRLVYQNLISNAIKYSSKKSNAVIEIGCMENEFANNVYYVKDNGAGFNMKYKDKLFGIFSRLHRIDEFEGIGIGLANVRRIVNRHNGRVWAEAVEGEGATFYFTLQENI